MMHYTDNPARDAENYYEDGMKEMRERPVCEYCGKHIADDICYEIDGNIVCDDCILDYLHDNCRVKTEEVI